MNLFLASSHIEGDLCFINVIQLQILGTTKPAVIRQPCCALYCSIKWWKARLMRLRKPSTAPGGRPRRSISNSRSIKVQNSVDKMELLNTFTSPFIFSSVRTLSSTFRRIKNEKMLLMKK